MPDSEIVRLAREQKRRLLVRETEQMREFARRWLTVERALEAEMLRTAVELGGEQLVTEAMVLRNTRFQGLMYQARAEYAKFANYMDERVTDLQTENVAQGVNDAYKLLRAGMSEMGTQVVFDKLNVSAINMMAGYAADGSPLRTLLMRSYGESVNGIMNAMLTGLAQGLNPNKVAGNMADGFGVGLQRAMTIARTEQLRAYRMGTQEQYRESGVVGQYKRMATKDGNTCLGCLMQDGEVFDNADEFAEHPNGRCVLIPIVRGAPEPMFETGREWLAGQSEERQREILGNARFELWQNGTPLESMSTLVQNSTWGGSFVPTPLRNLDK